MTTLSAGGALRVARKSVGIVLSILGFMSLALAQDDGPCSVEYFSPTPGREQQLVISADATGAFDSTKKVMSELGPNRWFATVDPVYTRHPPWNTTVFIGDRKSDKPFLKISILGHGNSLNVKWVTDRLLHIHIWWGRFGMSDWLIDVERRKVVYDELLNYLREYDCEVESAKEEAAQDSATKWLGLVDAGDYAASWDQAAQFFKNAVSKEEWTEKAKAVRAPLGKLNSRKLISATPTSSLPGAPEWKSYDLIQVQYDSSFEHKKSAVETVTGMWDKDGQWRVAAYSIK